MDEKLNLKKRAKMPICDDSNEQYSRKSCVKCEQYVATTRELNRTRTKLLNSDILVRKLTEELKTQTKLTGVHSATIRQSAEKIWRMTRRTDKLLTLLKTTCQEFESEHPNYIAERDMEFEIWLKQQ